MMMRSKGFTLIGLLVVIVILVIIFFLLAPATRPPGELSTQASCIANLNGIGKAVALFKAEDRNSRFPLLFTTGQPEANIRSTDGAKGLNELKAKLVGREATMQNVWVLIKKGLVSEIAFACPSDKDSVERTFKDKTDRRDHKYGWQSSANFSYGMHFPYESTTIDGKLVDNPAHLGEQLDGRFVVMADKNPSATNEPATGVGPNKSPSNHGDEGEAYLMFSGAANWKKSAKDSRINFDDIYTIQPENNANPSTPADIDDQYITRHPIDE